MRLLRLSVVACFSIGFAASLRALDQRYADTLRALCDALVSAQIDDRASPEYGALVCPSRNPQEHPLHSRAGESVYPLSIAYGITRDAKYRDAAIRLADWMTGKQQSSGAWGENAPNYDGWTGTTADQLISLAGAYPMLREHLSAAQRVAWQQSMRRAADYVVASFPIGNINYQPTGAVALILATRAVENPSDAWQQKAASLVALTLDSINADGLIVGEGRGVDLGYNLAQTIGYLALYGMLQSDDSIRHRAAELLRTHACFVYPNGSVDNSWGTRSFKWTLESGTKTAPGVYFTFALLADQDADFENIGRRCVDFLAQRTMAHGLVLYGPYADQHASTNPPCLYSTFTRAQSIAMAIAYAAPTTDETAAAPAPRDARATNWYRFFPSVKVAVVRTARMMATISAYGETGQYARTLVSRGGSMTNLWIDGFGRDGFAQTSSVSVYKREEAAHMPIEGSLRPLTPRVEGTIDGVYCTNLFETDGEMTVTREADHVRVSTSGVLRSATGDATDIRFTITHRFYDDRLTKEYVLTSPTTRTVRIVEPFAQTPAARFTRVSPRQIEIQPSAGDRAAADAWTFEIADDSATNSGFFTAPDADQYWCPFPAIECHPIALDVKLEVGKPTATLLTLRPR